MKFLIYLSFVILTANAATLFRKNDVSVAENNGIIKCDEVACPENTVLCHVLKETDARNSEFIRHKNTCYSEDGTVLSQALKITPAKDSAHVFMDLTADRNGLIILNEQVGLSFHLSTRNLRALKGKQPGYIKGIGKAIAATHAFVARRLNSLFHKGKA